MQRYLLIATLVLVNAISPAWAKRAKPHAKARPVAMKPAVKRGAPIAQYVPVRQNAPINWNNQADDNEIPGSRAR